MNQTVASSSSSARVAEPPLPLAIRALRRANPFIAAVLRSRLHRLLSGNLLLLTYVGAKSGVRRTLPLSFIELDGRTYGCTRNSAWWRNLRNGRPVELQLRGELVVATPVVVDPRAPEALDAFRAFLGVHPKTGETLYEVRTDRERRPLEEDVRREVLRSVVIRFDVGPQSDRKNASSAS